MIECKLREIDEYPSLESKKKKLGRYHQSIFGNKKENMYVIGAYIDGDFKQYIDKEMREEQILEECLLFLNSKTRRKSKRNKVSKCIYGKLEDYQSSLKYDEKEEKYYFEALLLTDERKNEYFWSEGRKKEIF